MGLAMSMAGTLTPAQAAQLSGISRWTIVRAVQSGQLKAHRNNRGHWLVERDAFEAWCSARGAQGALSVRPGADAPPAPSDLAAELRGAIVERDQLRERLAEAQADRDAWRALAQRSWWARWFGGAK